MATTATFPQTPTPPRPHRTQSGAPSLSAPSSSSPRRPQPQPSVPSSQSAASSSRISQANERPLSMASFRSGLYESEPDGGRRKRKPKPPQETHIFVRPPPSAKTLMNVQCQLVAHPTGAARTASESTFQSAHTTRGARSASNASAPMYTESPHQSTTSLVDSSADTENSAQDDSGDRLEVVQDGGPAIRSLSRSPSVKSTASGRSATSTATVASTASGNAKRITPLWNLNYHTVMTTFISDAGTDAKIVKFLKRGIAVHKLGYLEPYEHWPSVTSPSSSTHPSPSNKYMPLPVDSSVGRHSLDTVFSRQSILSAHSAESANSGGDDAPGPKKLFGRFFGAKKKESGGGGSISGPDFASFFKSSGSVGSLFASKENIQPPSSPSASSAVSVTPTASPQKSFAALGVPGSPSARTVVPPSVKVGPAEADVNASYLGHPTLGTQPIVRPLPANERTAAARPSAYIWVVTRWSAGDDGWTFAGLSDALSLGAGAATALSSAATTVRFEWIRGATPKRPETRRRVSGNNVLPANGASRANGNGVPPVAFGNGASNLGPGPPSPSLSRTSLALSATGTSESNHRHSFDSRLGTGEVEPSDDAQAEEDREDCEVPWNAYVVRSTADGTTDRALIGTLSPAPHHPKVLAQLKTPFPLNPFPLPGLTEMEVLSPDQLKDVLCATAMYLLIREEWGGIGKKKKDASVRR